MKSMFALMALAAALVMSGARALGNDTRGPSARAQEAAAGEVDGRFGEVVAQWDELAEPLEALPLDDGGAWVLEAAPPRLLRLDADGARARVELALVRPLGLAPAPDGGAWILDAGGGPIRGGTGRGGSVLRVDRAGALLTELDLAPLGIGTGGAGPRAFAAAGERLAIADGARVLLIDSEGGELIVIGARGEHAPLVQPMGLAFDTRRSHLIVADAGRHVVVRYSLEGEHIDEFGGFGAFPGLFARPVGIEVAGDRLYVAEEQNHRVQVFALGNGAATPERLYEWGIHVLRPGEGRGRLHYPTRVRVTLDDEGAPRRALVAEPFADRVQVFGPAAGSAAQYMNDPAVTGGRVSAHLGPEVTARGSLGAVLEPESQEVRLFDLRHPMPIEIGRFGGQGSDLGRFTGAIDLAFGPPGDDGEPSVLYVLDALSQRLSEVRVEFDPEAEPAFSYMRMMLGRSLDLAAWRPGCRPLAIATSPGSDCLALLDGGVDGAALLWVSPEFELLREHALGPPIAVPRSGRLPAALALDEAAEHAMWLRGSDDGQWVWTEVGLGDEAQGDEAQDDGTAPRVSVRPAPVPAIGAGDGSSDPGGLAGLTRGEDRVWFATDRARHALWVFDEQLQPTASMGGTPGLGAGEFRRPRGLAFDGQGRALVSDHGNHRLLLIVGDEVVGAFGPRLYTAEVRR